MNNQVYSWYFDYSLLITSWCSLSDTTCMTRQRNTARIMCVCGRIVQQKKVVMRRCVSFVDRLIAAFCCNLRTSRIETGSQSSCASSHRTVVDKAVNASLWEGTGGSSAMSSSSSSSSSQSGKVTVSSISSSVSVVCPGSLLSVVNHSWMSSWLPAEKPSSLSCFSTTAASSGWR